VSDVEMVEVRLRLPRYLARFLREFSEEVAMTPSQLVATLLHYYYVASLVGRRMALEEREAVGEGGGG
jgi:hypothetical protein